MSEQFTMPRRFAHDLLGALFNGPTLNPAAFERIKQEFAAMLRTPVQAQGAAQDERNMIDAFVNSIGIVRHARHPKFMASQARALLAQSQPTPADPLDWPLPCAVTVGCCTMRKGVPLRTLVAHMGVLHGMAMAAAPAADPGAWLAATQAVMPDGSQRDLGGAAPAAGSAP